MKNKKIRLIGIILVGIILAVVLIKNVYAVNELQMSFATVSSNNVVKGESFNINLDLSKISYAKYSIKLTSNIDMESPVVSNEENKTQINNLTIVNSSNSNSKEFTISDISNLNNLLVQYKVPENVEIGTKITIDVLITNLEQDSTNNTVSNNMTNVSSNISVLENNVISQNNTIVNNNDTTDNKTMSCQIILTVVESENTNNTQNSDKNNNSASMNGLNQMSQTSNSGSSNSGKTSSSISTAGSVGGSSLETVTYNGSSDNYLTDILIDNVSVNENFNKTNTTYFKTVESGTSSVKISYIQSNSNSIVTIYGNSNLQTGTNKILITVTAQDGSVRIYRIYVTVE